MKNKAIVIGSGIAGLAAALRLRHKGYDTIVFEAEDKPGGKMGLIKDSGYRWDTGPSLFTMPQFVDELFELYDCDPRKQFSYTRNEILCHYFWNDGSLFKAPASINDFLDSASVFFETSKSSLKTYLDKAAKKYELTAPVFLEKSLHKISNYLSIDTFKAIGQIGKLNIDISLDELNRRCFKNEKLIQLFNRYATYNGSSPYRTPGIMSMIPHLEMHYGSFSPKGGMHSIADSLYRLALEKGVKFSFNDPVSCIRHIGKKITGVKSQSGEHNADIVVSNMDIFSSYDKLLEGVKRPERILAQEQSSSAIIFYWGIKKSFPNLHLHNIFFSKDYRDEFSHIFQQGTITDDPTIYINITSKVEPDDAPEECENWFVMINAPVNEGQDWAVLRKKARQTIIKKLSSALHEDIESLIEVEHVWDPPGIESRTSSHKGALYGSSSNSKFAAFLRHPNFSDKIEGLYFCGGSVHPGGGIPLCLLSAKIVSDLIPEA